MPKFEFKFYEMDPRLGFHYKKVKFNALMLFTS